MMSTASTIAAVATSLGEAAVGIIRLSGPQALAIATRLTPGRTRAWQPRLATLAVLRRADGTRLDEALVLWFPAPHSVTGEEVVELQCHGGRLTLQTVLDACLDAGARPAEPGEFSRRALLNGRLDLLQVEAIADVIAARSEAARVLAQDHLAGRLSKRVGALTEALATLMMLVEAAIDFSLEEHVYSLGLDEVLQRLAPVQAGVAELLATWDAGRLRHDGIRVAIIGRPNAGKSSLLNALLGQDRALVTEIAGTTRDYLEEGLQVQGLRFVLVDTAGIRATDDRVEALGVERSLAQATRADVLWLMLDASDPGDPGDLLEGLTPRPLTVLANKQDLQPEGAPQPWTAPSDWTHVNYHALSLQTGAGCDALPELLLQSARAAGVRQDEDSVLITRARHRESLLRADAALDRAAAAAESGRDHELVALDLRLALDALGELTGAVTSEDILRRIFEGFCVGK